jgi:trimeric autotransporter adhesin
MLLRSLFSEGANMFGTYCRVTAFTSVLLICSVLFSCGGGSNSNGTPTPSQNPAPQIQSISPSTAAAGTSGFTIAVTGSNFVSGSVITWNGNSKPTTYVSSTQLTAAIAASDLSAAGTIPVTVTNPSPGGGKSSVSFTIGSPAAPIVSALSPNTAIVGGAAFTLTVNGTNFVQNSAVQWNGSAVQTNYLSNTQLSASIPGNYIASVGPVPVSVSTPGPGGGGSSSMPLTVEYPLPAITSLSPTGVVIGSGPVTLTVNGSNFVQGATVYWNNISRVTTFISSTQLQATILASDIAVTTAGTAPVTVQNPSPSAGISNIAAFNLENPVPVITSITPTSALAGTSFTLTINGSGLVSGATVKVGNLSLKAGSTGSSLSVRITPSLPVNAAVPVTVINPQPSAGGPSNTVTFNSFAAGAGLSPTVVSIDPNGNLVNTSLDSGTHLAQGSDGRYFAFTNYLRDTCLAAPSGCTPSTLEFAPPAPNPPYPPTWYTPYSSVDGRYVVSELLWPGMIQNADLDISDTCLGAPTGCTPITQQLIQFSYDGVSLALGSLTPDGRYVTYVSTGPTSPGPTAYIFDTCAGAAPGCNPTSITLDSLVYTVPVLSGNGRYAVYSQKTSNQTNAATQVVLRDTCLGPSASPGCAPANTVIASTNTSGATGGCPMAVISSDAQYIAYQCDSAVYLTSTCIGASGSCTPTNSQIASYDPNVVGIPSDAAGNFIITSVNDGGRFVTFSERGSTVAGTTINNRMTFVYDSCNGAPSGCVPQTVPMCLNSSGAVADGDCYLQGMSSDGQYMFFSSTASNFITLPTGVAGVSYVVKNPLK